MVLHAVSRRCYLHPMEFERVPLPECAVCHRPVDELRTYRDDCTFEFVVVALCHGKKETVRVPMTLMQERAWDVTMGRVFEPAAAELAPRTSPRPTD